MDSADHIEGFSLGLTASLLIHSVFLYILFFGLGITFNNQTPPTIYSVTLEGGKVLGGIDQAAAEKKKIEEAPPKATSSTEKKQETTPEEPDAEVKIPDEKKEKKEEKKEEKKQEPKPTPKATPKATPKPTPKAKSETQTDINKQLDARVQRYLGESSNAAATKRFGAAALGGAGTGGGTVVPPEVRNYILQLRTHFRKGWNWHDKSRPLSATVRMRLSVEGKVLGYEINQGSGSREFDESVLRAIGKGNPAPPPPTKYYKQYFQLIEMVFDPSD